LHEPFLNPDFLSSHPGILLDGLFLKDARFDWYTGGFEGLAEDFSTSVTWLGDFLCRHGYETVFLGGQSSGAYAAMRVARRIHPTAVIAFAPQTRNMTDARGQQQPSVELEDLAEAYCDWDAGFPIYLHLARSERDNEQLWGHPFFWDDWKQIAYFLDKNNVTVIRHPFDTHVISIPLYGLGLFYRSILSNVMLHLPKSVSGTPVETGEPADGPPSGTGPA